MVLPLGTPEPRIVIISQSAEFSGTLDLERPAEADHFGDTENSSRVEPLSPNLGTPEVITPWKMELIHTGTIS